MKQKSTLKEIEARFDRDVERFSNLETGQATTVDARYNMELIIDGILQCYPQLDKVLDIGCGAGNYAVKLVASRHPLDVTLVDLSAPMLVRAEARVSALNSGGSTQTVQGDFRTVALGEGQYDVIVATAVLHHLRDDADWEASFARLYRLLRPGGSLWVFDLVSQSSDALQELIYTQRYGEYLIGLKDAAYRDAVFAYIEKEDSPRSVVYQLDVMRRVGFEEVDVLHKNLCFASYVGFKQKANYSS